MKLIKSENKINKLSIIEAPDYQGWLRNLNLRIPKIIRLNSSHKVGLDPLIVPGKLTRAISSEEKSLIYSDYLIGATKSVAEAARKTYLKTLSNETPIKIIYNGTNEEFFTQYNEHETVANRIVFAGRLSVKKGVIELMKAWPAILLEFPNAELILVGKDSEYGESKSMIKELLYILPDKTGDRVIFKSFMSPQKLLELFQSASICVFPSHREAFGLVVTMAMAAGKPVVYSKIGPGYEIIEDGVNGFLCDPHNPNDIADKVIHLLKNKDLRDKFGYKARQHVINNFSLDQIVERNLEYYKSCIQEYYLTK